MTTDFISKTLADISSNYSELTKQVDVINDASARMIDAIKRGGKILFCGNGGSAADAQHLAAELMGRFMVDRAPLPAMALNVNTSAITAIANDYSYSDSFVRQVQGIGKADDLIVGISTSGNSENVVKALTKAKEMGMTTVGFTGTAGGQMKEICDVCITVPATSTPRVQEMHIGVGHIICEIVEKAFV